MKFFAVALLGLVAAVSAIPAPGLVNTGHSAQFRSQDSLGNYAFGYNEDHATGGTFRRETGSPGVAEGSYGLRVADGRVRVVNYVADALGFRANVQTNEPGVEDQDPASVLINKAASIVAPYIKAPVVAAAPLAIQQSIEAPIVQQTYEQAPLISAAAAPIVQQYEQAPIIEQAPIVQQTYEQAPIVQQTYEQAPIVQQTYEQAPIVQQAYQPSLISTGYTTKTYAAPSPILSAGPAAYGPAGYASAGPIGYAAAGPAGPYGAASYATKSVAPIGITSASLGLGINRLASPALAAKSLTLGGYGGAYGGQLIKK